MLVNGLIGSETGRVFACFLINPITLGTGIKENQTVKACSLIQTAQL